MKLAQQRYNVIYVIQVDSEAHKGLLKIGKTTIEVNTKSELPKPDSPDLEKAVLNGRYEGEQIKPLLHVLHTEVGFFTAKDGNEYQFDDTDVHEVLENSGHLMEPFEKASNIKEWFRIDLQTALDAIQAVKEGRQSILTKSADKKKVSIHFREEQTAAIERTVKWFESGNEKMLWNAKMRFGKTLCALEVVRRRNYKRTLILTHRPVVRAGWFEDFGKLPFDLKRFQYGCNTKNTTTTAGQNKGQDIDTLEADFQKSGKHYIYFASMQDLRGSTKVGGNIVKQNECVFTTDWDLIILDEAHEGTQTDLGQAVIRELQSKSESTDKKVQMLYLSGTPFNIVGHFDIDEIFTWDYEMEQNAKAHWAEHHPKQKNAYEGLPRLTFYCYRLSDLFTDYQTEEEGETPYFNFREFFRTWKGDEQDENKKPLMPEGKRGHFVHETDVKKFLDLLSEDNEESIYPFTNPQNREILNHTFWLLPSVAACSALQTMLGEHSFFKNYEVVNVGGAGNKLKDEDDTLALTVAQTKKEADKEETKNKNALAKVQNAIEKKPRTITLSCGRLTTGVTVPEWTGILMLKGGANVKSAGYLQAVFRVQSPFKGGLIKANCYAFDFAPDRTLEVLDDYVTQTHRQRNPTGEHITHITEFLQFCAVIAQNGSKMENLEPLTFLRKVNEIVGTRIVLNGFKDKSLFGGFEQLSDEQKGLINEMVDIFSQAASSKSSQTKTDVNNQGVNEKNTKDKTKHKDGKRGGGNGPKPPKDPRAEEQRRFQKAMFMMFSRFPLMLFGAVTDANNLTIKKFVEEDVSNEDWKIFMPLKFTKEKFLKLIEILNTDKLRVGMQNVIDQTKAAELLPVEQRVAEIIKIIERFHYPDKETVLTPWSVVNRHMVETVGGYNFFDEHYDELLERPVFVKQAVSSKVWGEEGETQKWLEINSKSGVYPLWLAYNGWRRKVEAERAQHKTVSPEREKEIWAQVLREQVYVICQTPMAAKITHRALAGYQDCPTHCLFEPDLNKLMNAKKPKERETITQTLVKNLHQASYWAEHEAYAKQEKKNEKNNEKQHQNDMLQFSAVVGNPPYQISKEDPRQPPIYHLFYDLGFELADIVTLITPGRFLFNAGFTPEEWNQKMLSDEHIRVAHYEADSQNIFSNVDIKGGVAILLRDANQILGPIGVFTAFPELNSIIQKVQQVEGVPYTGLNTIVSPKGLYRFTDTLFAEKPQYKPFLENGAGKQISSIRLATYPELFLENKPQISNDYYLLVGRNGNERVTRWVKRTYIANNEYLPKWNVFVPAANGTGAIGEVLSTPMIGQPMIGHTNTFLSIGCFGTEAEATACLKYIKTKFARTMLGILKVTQNNPRDTWAYIPLQDFTAGSTLDWSQSVQDIDRQLYKMYGLDQAEIDFIETNIREMV